MTDVALETRDVPVVVAPVLRLTEPPLPETMAYIRRQFGVNVVVVVDPTAVDE